MKKKKTCNLLHSLLNMYRNNTYNYNNSPYRIMCCWYTTVVPMYGNSCPWSEKKTRWNKQWTPSYHTWNMQRRGVLLNAIVLLSHLLFFRSSSDKTDQHTSHTDVLSKAGTRRLLARVRTERSKATRDPPPPERSGATMRPVMADRPCLVRGVLGDSNEPSQF